MGSCLLNFVVGAVRDLANGASLEDLRVSFPLRTRDISSSPKDLGALSPMALLGLHRRPAKMCGGPFVVLRYIALRNISKRVSG